MKQRVRADRSENCFPIFQLELVPRKRRTLYSNLAHQLRNGSQNDFSFGPQLQQKFQFLRDILIIIGPLRRRPAAETEVAALFRIFLATKLFFHSSSASCDCFLFQNFVQPECELRAVSSPKLSSRKFFDSDILFSACYHLVKTVKTENHAKRSLIQARIEALVVLEVGPQSTERGFKSSSKPKTPLFLSLLQFSFLKWFFRITGLQSCWRPAPGCVELLDFNIFVWHVFDAIASL